MTAEPAAGPGVAGSAVHTMLDGHVVFVSVAATVYVMGLPLRRAGGGTTKARRPARSVRWE